MLAVNKNNIKIHVEDLCKSFHSLKVLQGITTNIYEGEVVVVIGPSGSGKSTFLRCLNRLEDITSGTVTVDGYDVSSKKTNINKMRENVGMVFQHFNLFNNLNVLENLMLAPVDLKKETKDKARVHALQMLEKVGLSDKAEAYPSQLSGGQKQRVAIAGVLAMQPKVLVLDEPTAMLDPVGRREVMNTVWRLNKEQGMTVVLITHYMEEADGADRVLVMDNGKITADDTPNGVFSNPELLKKAGLALPQTAELLLRLKQEGLPVEQGVINAKQTAKAIAKALKGGRAAW